MKFIKHSAILFLIVIVFEGCIKEKDNEEEKPQIELISPLPCDTLYFHDEFRFIVKIRDNMGLGNISMDLHNNFGHHNHGDHETCNMDNAKDPINPYDESWIFSLPNNKKEHIFDTLLFLPAIDEDSASYDTGDYHFHIYMTDNDGYQVFTSLDVKVLY